jgi:hypothetical protein
MKLKIKHAIPRGLTLILSHPAQVIPHGASVRPLASAYWSSAHTPPISRNSRLEHVDTTRTRRQVGRETLRNLRLATCFRVSPWWTRLASPSRAGTTYTTQLTTIAYHPCSVPCIHHVYVKCLQVLLRVALLADSESADVLTPALPLHEAPTLFWGRLDNPAPKHPSSDARSKHTHPA